MICRWIAFIDNFKFLTRTSNFSIFFWIFVVFFYDDVLFFFRRFLILKQKTLKWKNKNETRKHFVDRQDFHHRFLFRDESIIMKFREFKNIKKIVLFLIDAFCVVMNLLLFRFRCVVLKYIFNIKLILLFFVQLMSISLFFFRNVCWF